MKVSIIIPVKHINDYICEGVKYHLNLDYTDYEILIFPDEIREQDKQYEWLDKPNIRVIPSGVTGPAEKRDMSLQYAEGEIFAFIDDDAYPSSDWLKNAVKLLEDPDIGAVGGPAVTAPEDDIWKKGSGKVLESFLCSGKYTYRYLPGERREDDDIPSVNLIVRRDIFETINGFDSSFYPGEDTKLCMDIVNLGKKLIYDPEVLVYHHRRKLYKGHLKQISNYAKHRGYFAKKLPQTSLRLAYFVPSIFTLGVLCGPLLSMMFPALWWLYGGILLLYFLLASYSLRTCDNLTLFFLSLLGIFLTHISYGIFFVRGLLSRKLLR